MTTTDRAPGEGFLVLWAGGLEIAERDAQVELRRAGVRVEVTDAEELFTRTNARAPDLVVLGGELGADPDRHASALAAASPSASVPIVALVPRDAAAPRPRARFGVVARFDRELEPPALAAQLTALLNALSTRAAAWRVKLKSGLLGPLASRFAALGRAGLLTVAGSGAIAVEAKGAAAPDTIPVPTSVKEALFHERPAGRVRVLLSLPRKEETAPSLDGVRVLVIDDDAERRETIAKRFEQAGAEVRATGLVAQAIHASRALDPSVVVVGAPAMRASAVAPLWNEPRLVPASLLVIDGDALAHPESGALLAEVSSLARAEASLRRRLRDREAVADRLESLGPARWLKLLGRCEHDVTLRVFAASGRVRVDLEGGRIQGASFYPLGTDEIVDGRAAVDALMGIPFGRVLAGPPDALAAIEGVSSKRRASVVGRIEPTPPSGVRRRHGLVAEEVVVKRTDATDRPIAPPKLQVPAGALVSSGDAEETDDDETSAYSAETVAELRSALGEGARTDAPTAPPPNRALGEKVQRPTEVEVKAADPPLAVEERAASPEPAPPIPAEDRAKPVRAAPAEDARAVPVVQPRAARGGNGAWYAAAIALALGVGGWAAWRLHGEDAARARAGRRDPSAAEARGDIEHAATQEDEASQQIAVAGQPSEDEASPNANEAIESANGSDAIADANGEEAIANEAIPSSDANDSAANEASADGPDPGEANAGEESADAEPDEANGSAGAANADTSAADTSGESAPALIGAALAAARDHDYARSEALSRRALELSPRNSRAGYRLAVALFQQSRYPEALETAREVSRWDSHDALPRALIGDIYSRRGLFVRAARAYQQALEADPSFQGAQRSLERLHARGIDP